MDNKDDNVSKGIAVFFLVVMIIPSVMWQGYVLSVMWNWFVSPTFDIPNLKIAAALGMAAIFSFMSPTANCAKEDANNDSIGATVLKSVLRAFGKPAMFLLFGWIVKQWM
jgi:hypothetical protein